MAEAHFGAVTIGFDRGQVGGVEASKIMKLWWEDTRFEIQTVGMGIEQAQEPQQQRKSKLAPRA